MTPPPAPAPVAHPACTLNANLRFRNSHTGVPHGDNDNGDATEKHHYLKIIEARGYFIMFKNKQASPNKVACEMRHTKD